MVSPGSQAKWYLKENLVKPNGELEDRRGKKMHAGDVLNLVGEEYELVSEQPMYLANFELKDSGNFKELRTNFDPHVNIFIDPNAQGKINLPEVIYSLALTRSHRTNSDKELILFGSKFAGLQGRVHKSQLQVEFKLRLVANGKKAWVNRLEQKRLSVYVGQMNAILFSPKDLALVKGAPSVRWRFMGLEFGQINPEYLYFSSQYRQVSQQRNNYLRQLSIKKAND